MGCGIRHSHSHRGVRRLIEDRTENVPQGFRCDPVSAGVFGRSIFGVSRSSAVLRSGVPKTIVFGGSLSWSPLHLPPAKGEDGCNRGGAREIQRPDAGNAMAI